MATIVIVDDSQANLKIYAKLSESIGPDVTVQTFNDPNRALDWLGANAADLVISDFKMPGMLGAEFTRRLRMLQTCEDLPIIVVTVFGDRDYRIEALQAGATDFLHSPVDHSEFRTRVRNLLLLGLHQRMTRDRAGALERELRASEKSREQLLRDSRERLAQVIDTVPVMISATDAGGRSILCNSYHIAVLGEDVPRPPSEAYPDHMVVSAGEASPSFEEKLTDKFGEKRVFLTTKSPLRDATGRVTGVLTTALDITERKQAEARLIYEAHHDPLTTLPNRALLYERVGHEIAAAAARGSLFALHFIDLDRFKYVNDGLGHHFGDQLLQTVGQRLRHTVRASDLVARLGGDEFAVLQNDLRNATDAALFAERLNHVLQEPCLIQGREVALSASIGVAIYPRDGSSPEELLRNADLAMYQVKAVGRNGYEFFETRMLSQALDAISLQTALQSALKQGEFVLHYQPQVDLHTGRVCGAEALIRWRRGPGPLINPGAFLRVAEDSGLMRDIDEWVLREACRQAEHWRQTLACPVRISVNLSPLQFRSGDLCALVNRVLSDTGLPPDLLDLELTEGILQEHAASAVHQLEELHKRGVRLSIDDFGTGYSSLARLTTLPVDTLKIDKSFVCDLDTTNNIAVVRAIVSLGRAFGVSVLAEGVETLSQLQQIKLAGCDTVQGFYYAEALPVPAFEHFVGQGGMPRVAGVG